MKFIKLPTFKNNRTTLYGACGASTALTIAELTYAQRCCTLVLTPNVFTATTLEQELIYLLGAERVFYFPDWETLPYDTFSPYQDIISRRLEILAMLPAMVGTVIITSVTTVMGRLAPQQYIQQNALLLQQGQTIDLAKFKEHLINSGYTSVRQVLEHGEFAIRGSIIDLYPMGSNKPYRLDLFDDTIDSIAIIDLETQRSLQKVANIKILPAHEFPIDDTAINDFRRHYREVFNPSNITLHNIYQQLSHKILPAGIEYYLPLFFDNTATFFDYLPKDSQIICVGALQASADEFFKDVVDRAHRYISNPDHPSLSPETLFIASSQIYQHINAFSNYRLSAYEAETGISIGSSPLPPLAFKHNQSDPIADLKAFVNSFTGRILFTVASEGRKTVLLDLLKNSFTLPEVSTVADFISADSKMGITVAPFNSGCIVSPELAIITESELLGTNATTRVKRGRRKSISPDAIIKNLVELTPGDIVVHEQYGIAKYDGLQTLKIEKIKSEFVTLIFANDTKMFVPITNLYLLSRYNGRENVELTKLGTDAWKKARNKAIGKIRDVAASLLDIYAKRQIRLGYQYVLPQEDYATFVARFPYQTTEDQEKAIEAVLADMQSSKPMDRLICGDVGFGKTEVAMRAAFVAVHNNKQVVVLVPTTLLAEQHYESFMDRFANTPVRIASLNRFRTTKEQNKILQDAVDGQVDILIGTHKLLNKKLTFKALGLLIIDEEHRFGVTQKEKIKSLRAEVDVLTMTATPIPRTLNLAMNGIRDLSIIATPPAKRLAVRTFVHENSDSLIQEAVLRELKRGGQVYLLHNDVSSINARAEELATLVPEAHIAVAHAQLPEKELSRIMHDFYHQRFSVLVCSTIIETGIDVPTANTIIIDRADKFGLAQLHQLRGRVGRSHHQAYAYLLTPPINSLTADAKKRLQAITSLEELGSGFVLASQDLEIRGAGEILGSEQSGQIEGIGFNLYTEMLESAVKALQNGEEITEDNLTSREVSIELYLPVLFPDHYIFDITIRLSLYKRLASAVSIADVDDITTEIVDRFGKLPQETRNLIATTKLRLQAKKLGINSITMNASFGSIKFGKVIHVNFDYLTGLITGNPDKYRPDGNNGLKINMPIANPLDRLSFMEELVQDMTEHYV